MRIIFRCINCKPVPEIRNHPDFSAEFKHIRSFLTAVRNLFSNCIPMIQIVADCCVCPAFLVLVLVPHLVCMRCNFINAGINHALGIEINPSFKSPVPEVCRSIMQHPSRILPIVWNAGDVGDIHVIQTLCLDDLRCPERIVSRLNIKSLKCSAVQPFCAIPACCNAKGCSMHPGHTDRNIRGTALGVKQVPLFFFFIPDDRRIGWAVVNRIPE